ncbi:MAG TPA: ABC transporter ATP-binding protein [Gemmatimonadaceae bacterium]|jgi:molybdate transport system ATP-binding protein/molybdate/tungstate transport system ATP-binding protein|nr:ABC transporter ATP-binding protein [Gemmatimonadaceae bacterium]
MISLRHVNARAGKFALSDVSFDVPQGAYGVVIGPAGAGKTTLLETIAGLVRVHSGRVMLGGDDLTNAAPEARRLGIVYQHAYLFPHLTVRENVEYGASSRPAAEEMATRFGVAPLANRSVRSLSGGERQLVAIARALARRPEVMLLDEPFSALDPRTRNIARRVLRTVYFERHFTVLQVTHDFSEAGLLGDVAIVLDKGRVVQKGDPEQVFRRPASPYIADFLGAENVFAGTARPIRAEAPDWIESGEHEFVQHPVAFTTGSLTFYALGDVVPGPAHAVIRAEEVSLSAEPSMSSVQNQFRGRILEIVPAGALSRVTVDAGGTPIVAAVTARSVRELSLAVGGEVVAGFKATAVHLC